MNRLIEQAFQNFTVDGVNIPISYMFYEGHGEPYLTYMRESASDSYSGDNELMGWIEYIDIDVFSKRNYLAIVEAVIDNMRQNGFTFQPTRSSEDMYEQETGYYHRTLNFAIFNQIEEE